MDAILKVLADHDTVTLSGIQGSSDAYILSRLLQKDPASWIVVVRDDQRAETLARDIAFFSQPAMETVTFPSWEVLPFDQTSPYPRLQNLRIELLTRFLDGSPPKLTVASLGACMTRVAPRGWLRHQRLFLTRGGRTPMEEIARFLVERGYHRLPLVEEPGDFSIRGGILDVFPSGRERPVRVEFDGETVESLRSFSPETQRSTDRLETVELLPAREIPWSPAEREAALERARSRIQTCTDSAVTRLLENLSDGIPFPGMEFLLPLFHDQLETLFDYLPADSVLVLDEPDGLEEGWRKRWDFAMERAAVPNLPLARLVSPDSVYLSPDQMIAKLRRRKRLEIKGLHVPRSSRQAVPVIHMPIASHEGLRSELMGVKRDPEALGSIAEKFGQWLEKGFQVHWILRSPSRAERMREHLASSGIRCSIGEIPEPGRALRPRLWIHTGELSRGFLWEAEGIVFLTEEEVFGARRLHRRARYAQRLPSITHLEDLKEGDLVVHSDHGIGIYRGLVTLDVGGHRGDFLHLEYLGRDRLYVPVDRFQIVHKYIGTEGIMPRIDRLGGRGWDRRKRRVSRAVERMAKELLELYAAREVTPGYAFSPPDETYREFESAFSFEETPDQRQVIDDVMRDMGSRQPMDRLVCGDVGYGKTEVAMRAAYRAVMDGKQVAYLVPTTILAEQHFQTFLERFRGYPVFIEAISRFRTPREQREILERCREGKVDILIGTHRLLQKDVSFRDLGLLIIDEEQRFGVAHKERIKKFRKDVDVLTLTATPIPRTLHMAMLGIRDLSIIETPPPERLSIRTILTPFDREIVVEAVKRELDRGGQVFFLHNRVRTIYRILQTLQQWLPNVRMGVAHGQMPERDLARVMELFRGKEIDLLVCTTIIQSGLDIPTANTILIHRAHQLGLADMYQIRGRVGRSGHQAYAYLLTPSRHEVLTQDAAKRLETLQEFSELGAGFRIATRDLEIRGAGTLLGPSQSGHIDAVGFELYTQLLRRAIAELKGEPTPVSVQPEIQLPVHAYFPEQYIADAHQRLALYRRLSRIEMEEEIPWLREEIVDRYGSLPEEAENLIQLIHLRCLLRSMGIKTLSAADWKIRITFDPSTPVSPSTLIRLVEDHADWGIRFVGEDTLEIPMNEVSEDPIPRIATKRLKAFFQGASMNG